MIVLLFDSAGLGYKAKENAAEELKRKALSSDEKLRKQLLGKSAKAATKISKTQAKARPMGDEGDGSDDEGGRGSSFTSKRLTSKTPAYSTLPAGRKRASVDSDDDSPTEESVLGAGRPQASPARQQRARAAGSYLDEILEQKAKKRKKKKRKQNADGTGAAGASKP